ncbi:SET domain-containing protein RMS1 [Phaeosphaeriaceae sp. PMI808]|nr:SET domain-containing protein RMS1 [Phaeosphaeriaceae sp. PMI808]
MVDFQASTDHFLAWFKSVGGEFRDDLLEIKDFRAKDAGRGIVAIKDIPHETILFTIPRDAIINIETSELVEKLPNVFDTFIDDDDDDSEPLDSWGSLILIMIYEHIQGDASRWKPYLDVLPDTFDTPLFWTQSEMKELEGTCLTAEKVGKKESDDMLRTQILPIVMKNSAIFYAEGVAQLSEDDLLALAHRMGSTIMAYAFDLDGGDEKSDNEEDGWVEDREGRTMLGMVPMADMMNANAAFNAHVNHGDSLEVTALRCNLKAGTEVLNYYGPLPSSELLRRYGYVTPEHQRYNVAELPWKFVRSALGQELHLTEDVLSKVEIEMDPDELEDYFVIERDTGEPDSEGQLTHTAKLLEISPELDEQLKSFMKALKKLNPNVFNEKKKRDQVCNAAIASALEAKIKQYPTSKQEDEVLLKKGDLTKRYRMAVEVRLGEKELLQEAIALIKGKGGAIGEDDKGRMAKRPKTKA